MTKKKNFEIPETLDGLDREALNKIAADAKEYLRGLDDDATDAELEAGMKVADLIEEVGTKVADLDAQDAQRSEKLQRLRAAAEEPEENPDGEEDPDGQEDPEDEVETDPEADADLEAEVETQEPALVASAASRRRSAAKTAAANAKTPKIEPAKAVSIFATQDVRGYSAGTPIKGGMSELAKALGEKAKTLSSKRLGGAKGLQQRFDVARIDMASVRNDNLTEDAVKNGKFSSVYELFRTASNENRLEGNSLVAAGGWCAPPETMYGMVNNATTEGLLDLPTIQAKRGSIQFTKGVDFKTVFADADGDFNLTEAQVIAGTIEKPCIEVTCPDFDTVTLDATGVCISSSLLTKATYPEQVADFTEKVLVAHEHKKAKRHYDGIVAGSTALTLGGAVTAVDALNTLETLGNYMRESEKWSDGTAIEVLLPAWFKGIIRADIANRSGMGVSALNVTDAEIASWFTTRKLRPQWLRSIGQDIINTAGTITIPNTVELALYRAGTWVGLTTDVIDLGTVYDSTNLKSNVYTALFTEEGTGLANMEYSSFKVSLPTLANGVTAAQTDTAALVAQAA